MDIQFFGANCLVLTSKQARIVVDDNLDELGAKTVTKDGDIALFSHAHGVPKNNPRLIIDGPGEYEVSDISIQGIGVRSHMDETDGHSATMYKLVANDLRILVTGHIYPELSEAQLEAIGTVDIMFVPVGGSGYTLDGVGALKIIKEIEPKIIVPTHYADKSLKFEVPQKTLNEALTELSMEPKEKVSKLKIKATDLSDITQLIVLEKS